jgi:Tfp pilus assembly protein PilO
MEASEKQSQVSAKLLEHLYNPTKLRSLVTGLILIVGYVGIYMPFSGGMETTSRQRSKEKTRLELARDVEHLRVQFDSFKKRLPKLKDPNEWVEYVLQGVRKFPLKFSKMDVEDTRDLGPYKVVVMRMEFEGTFRDMDSFLSWLETNERMFRVDSVKIAPHRSGRGVLVMQMVVLGVMG